MNRNWNLTANRSVFSRVAAWTLALSASSTGAARAQVPMGGMPSTSTDAIVAQELTSQPIPGRGGVAITAAGSLQTGRIEIQGWSLQGIAANTLQNGLLLRLQSGVAVTNYRPAPGYDFISIEDNALVDLLALHRLRKQMSIIGTTGWREDRVLQLDYRAWAQAGVGFHILEAPPINLMVAPMFAIGHERRSYTGVASMVDDFSLLQQFTWRKVGNFSIVEYVEGRIDLADTFDRNLLFNVTAMTKIAPYTGLTVAYQYQYDSLVPVGVDNRLQKISLGIQVAFTKPRPPAPTPPADTPPAPAPATPASNP